MRIFSSKKVSYTHNTQHGFTLLLAVLVASLLTSVGLAMASIAQKQLVLSSVGRDSQYAFYAADTGALALGLDAAGFFDTFEIAPIIVGSESNNEITEAGTYTFDGSSQVATGFGTLFFIDALPDYAYDEGSKHYNHDFVN